ncbi:MAG TPA: hypothetical protein VFZ65_13885, partial [Planctomycetota bacterium]|nr:hypothetical protein [Planctomycetota bacterium]
MFPAIQMSTQVAVLQVSDQNGQLWQRYFHGAGMGPGTTFSTFARGISVFPADAPMDTRIAICGETYDSTLPAAVTPPYGSFMNLSPTGFIAVYDGNGNLLWSYQFYGQDQNAQTAIADVSIRIDNLAVPPRDVVTYCGFSTNGVYQAVPGNPTTMPPTLPFAPPANPMGCSDLYAAGNVHNAFSPLVPTNQWDGIVGRVSSPRNAVAVTLDFHSIVGGANDDVLLGISEVDRDRFAVVGATRENVASGLNSVFPLTRPWFTGTTPVCFATSPGLGLGVVMVFDAGPTRNNQALALLGSTLIGSPNGQTVARDVLFHGGL